MKHKILMILGISILLYKITTIGDMKEEGMLGFNEVKIVKTIIPESIYNFILEHGKMIKKPDLISYDNELKKRDMTFRDKEAYKGSLDFISGTLYFMFFISLIMIPFYFIKRKLFGRNMKDESSSLFFQDDKKDNRKRIEELEDNQNSVAVISFTKYNIQELDKLIIIFCLTIIILCCLKAIFI